MSNLINRLELIKDIDPFNKQLLNDCYLEVQSLTDEVKRLRDHNERLLQIIYQNHASLEENYGLAGTEQKL